MLEKPPWKNKIITMECFLSKNGLVCAGLLDKLVGSTACWRNSGGL